MTSVQSSIIHDSTMESTKSLKSVGADSMSSTQHSINIGTVGDNTEYTDDYRNILKNYDPVKNKTTPIMTSFEKALVLGKRATQIAYGAEPLFDVPARMTKVEDIAEEELRLRKVPFIIKRDLGNNKHEFWKIKDMIINIS